MKQLVYIKKNTLEWQDNPDMTLHSEDGVLVRPFAVARCDLDMALLSGRLSTRIALGKFFGQLDSVVPHVFGAKPFHAPFVIGHECVAEVLQCGAAVKNFKQGDQVIVPFQISCGHCLTCQSGFTGNCASTPPFSMYGGIGGKGAFGGAVSDLVYVPYGDSMLVNIPDGVNPIAVASAGDNIADAWRTVGPPLKMRPHSSVLVIGGAAKSIGLYAAAMAVALGASRVDYLDRNKERLELANKVGANPIDGNHETFTGSYDVVADATNSEAGLTCALRSCAPGGICTSVGIFARKKTGVPLMKMFSHDLTLKMGVSNSRANIPELLKLITAGKFKPELITTILANWEDAAEAFLVNAVKVVVHRPPLYAVIA